jgi:hypothetical protein
MQPKIEASFDFLLEQMAEEINVTGLHKDYRTCVTKISNPVGKKTPDQKKADCVKMCFSEKGTMPDTKCPFMALLLNLIGSSTIIDGLKYPSITSSGVPKTIVSEQYHFIDQIKSLVVNNGLSAPKLRSICSQIECNTHLIPAVTEEGTEDDEHKADMDDTVSMYVSN